MSEKKPFSVLRHRRFVALAGAALIAVPILAGLSWQPLHAESQPAQATVSGVIAPSGSFASIVAADKPAVVTVTTRISPRQSTDQGMPQFGPGSPFDEFFRQFFGDNGPMPHQMPQMPAPRGNRGPVAEALGSGFIINADGTIVTNNHVIDGASEIKVTLDDGSQYTAKLVAHDEKSDLAVLKIDAGKTLPTVQWGDSDKLQLGDQVLAIGNPFGIGTTVTAGIVSARGRDLHNGPYDDFIQVDAAINHGNSGGPLVDVAGKVVGINTAIYSPNGGNVGVGFAIPSNQAQEIVTRLIKDGSIEHGYLGVQIQQVTRDVADAIGLKDAQGALVAHVEDGSPADKAGIKAGDVVTGFNKQEVKTPKDLSRMVADVAPGTREELTLWRKGNDVEVPVTIGTNEGDQQASADTGTQQQQADQGQKVASLGIALSNLDDETRQAYGIESDDEGAVVTDVDPGKPAADQGLNEGDVIVSVNQQAVHNAREAKAAIASVEKSGRKSVLLQIERDGNQSFLAVPFAAA